MTYFMDAVPDPDLVPKGISRSLALSRVLYFEALMRRRLGESRILRYIRLHNYYSNQALPPDNVDQPLGINRFKTIVDKHSNYLFGEWKERLVKWRVTPNNKDNMDAEELEDANAYGQKIKVFLETQLGPEFDVMLWTAAKNSSLYGDGILEVEYDEILRKIVVKSVLPEFFHAMWQITDMQKLTEVIVAYPIDRLVALEQYGTSGNDQVIGYQAVNPHYLPGIGILWKRWSTTSFQVWIDDVNIIDAPNPYMTMDDVGNVYPGLIPFVHVKNMQDGEDYWGYSDGESVLYLIDELNRRMADIGDIVQTHAHPIVTLKAFTGTQQDLPVGPDAIWDLGKDGEAKRLEGTGPSPEMMEYVQAVKTELYETSNMPETAFGTRGTGSSHSSGLALAMAMMPVVERAREKRLFWSAALRRVAAMTFYMLAVRDPDILEAAGLSFGKIVQFAIEPIFADILPKDQLQSVNENVALSANNLRSQQRALEDLGEGDISAEMSRIQEDMQKKAMLGAPTPPPEGGTAGKNSEQGVGGSPGIPGGISPSLSKPGTMIKGNEQPKLDNVSLSQTV
jgi:hypothetical protein